MDYEGQTGWAGMNESCYSIQGSRDFQSVQVLVSYCFSICQFVRTPLTSAPFTPSTKEQSAFAYTEFSLSHPMLYQKFKNVSTACVQFPQSIRHVNFLNCGLLLTGLKWLILTYTEAVGVLTLTTRQNGLAPLRTSSSDLDVMSASL